MSKYIDSKREEIKNFVNSYKNKGKGIKDAVEKYNIGKTTIYKILKE